MAELQNTIPVIVNTVLELESWPAASLVSTQQLDDG